MPPLLDYENLVPPPPTTRASLDYKCQCTICCIARKNGQDYIAFAKEHENKRGAPSSGVKSPAAKSLALCNKCWGQIGKGIPHNCSKVAKVENLSSIVKDNSDKSRSKIASSTIKKIAEDAQVTTRGGVVQLQTGSKPLSIQIGAKVKTKISKVFT